MFVVAIVLQKARTNTTESSVLLLQFITQLRLNLQCAEYRAVQRAVKELPTKPSPRALDAVTVLKESQTVHDSRRTSEMLARRNQHLITTTEVLQQRPQR